MLSLLACSYWRALYFAARAKSPTNAVIAIIISSLKVKVFNIEDSLAGEKYVILPNTVTLVRVI